MDLRAPQERSASIRDRLSALRCRRRWVSTIPLTALGRFTYGLDYAAGMGAGPAAHHHRAIRRAARCAGHRRHQTPSMAGLAALRQQLPTGYRIDIGGSVEENAKAQASILAQMPLLVIAVLTLLMMQLQSFSRVLMVDSLLRRSD